MLCLDLIPLFGRARVQRGAAVEVTSPLRRDVDLPLPALAAYHSGKESYLRQSGALQALANEYAREGWLAERRDHISVAAALREPKA